MTSAAASGIAPGLTDPGLTAGRGRRAGGGRRRRARLGSRALAALAGALAAAVLCAPVRPARAQRTAPEAALVSVGGQVGSLGGLTLRTPARTPASWTLTLGFDGRGEAVLGLGRQAERRLPGSPLHAFVTPGAFASASNGRAGAGATLGVGFGFYRHRYDVYVTAVPTLALVGVREARVDLGTGVRYAF